MASESTKYTLQQAYINEKARVKNRKGQVRVDPRANVWEKLGDIVEGQEIDPTLLIRTIYSVHKNPIRLFPNMLLDKELIFEAIERIREQSNQSELYELFEGMDEWLLPYAIRFADTGDLGDPKFKRLLWEPILDGVPPFPRLVWAYPELPKIISDLENPMIKRVIRSAHYTLLHDPAAEVICERFKIDKREFLNWEVFDGII